MVARLVPSADDPVEPEATTPLTITVNGERIEGRAGQTLAGVLLAADIVAWRATPFRDRPRGAFCGIGVCFDCLVVVNGQRDVRACQRRAVDGDVLEYSVEPSPARSDVK